MTVNLFAPNVFAISGRVRCWIFPELKSAPAPKDADNDGLPDDWETQNGLDPQDPSDNNKDKDGDCYTNLEEWLNGTDPDKSDLTGDGR